LTRWFVIAAKIAHVPEINKSRSYIRLLEALKEPDCPICKLLLEDSRAYLDQLLYESVLDVPTRMLLMESFGFCSWHARQIPTLPAICAPNIGFSIFASDLLRKLDYAGRAMIQNHLWKRDWKSWFKKKPRTLASVIKERSCPACDHVKQFESYHTKDLLDSLGEPEFFEAYKTSQGICLPHFFILEQSCSSHRNFRPLLDAHLTKAKALRETLEEFIRKQDFRLSDEITPEETKAWKLALDLLTGKPGIFANEMGHDMFQRSQERIISCGKAGLTSSPSSFHSLKELLSELKTSGQVTVFLKKPLPSELFVELNQLAQERPKGTIEATVEDMNDVEYLRKLHSAGFSLFYGIGLPPQTIILLDRKRGFAVEDAQPNVKWQIRSVKNAEEVYFSLLWHRFGIAVLLSGTVKENDLTKGFFCLVVDDKREQWCRLRRSSANDLPAVGTNLEIFGWEKWNTHVIEVLELQKLETTEAIRR
jgi:hypothetical protein